MNGFSRLGRFLRDRRGSAAVEFGIVAPVLGLIFGGAVDLGGVVFVKFRLDNAVSAGANYALVSAANVTAEAGGALATDIATVITSSGGDTLTGTITVNNGPVAEISDGSVSPVTGMAVNADSCYCPALASSSLSWGAAVACGSACADGGQAGKFVVIETSRVYSPLFADYGVVDDGTISSRAVVRVQ